MLKNLHIKNIALIEEAEIEFCGGLNILSGETGAGKSIIVDSISFLLGTKADKNSIRSGESAAFVQGIFEIDEPRMEVLWENGFDFLEKNEPIYILRTLNASGKNECRINGIQISAAQLKKLTALLVDLHGQHEHQSLLNVSNHIKILDGFIKDAEFNVAIKNCGELYEKIKNAKKQLEVFGGNEQERARTLDLLAYQIKEISQAKLSEQEQEELLNRRQRLIHAEKIAVSLGDAYKYLSAEGGISGALSSLGAGARYDSQAQALFERLNSVKIELDDICDEIDQVLSDLQFDEKTADETERRLDTYRDLRRKYGKTILAVQEYFENASAEHERLLNAAEAIERLENEVQKLSAELDAQCAKASKLRRAAAKDFQKAVIAELNELGMANCSFEAVFSSGKAGARGFDEVEFYLSANKGEPIRPLSKIISGGEMSRLSLALKVLSGRSEQIATLIFDEIDTGISGKVGQTIAAKLAEVSLRAQVLCVTHLPQMAAFADSQYLISKSSEKDKTKTNVHKLDYNGMINEIGRLSGGQEGSERVRLQAMETKEFADKYKQQLAAKIDKN